ncbi:MAG TPA: hypothetical protein VMU68_07300 [Acidimicrobiales bacterium]|nr:hypothetical protein [Acidimicrobiales bacterium]
MTEMPLKKKKGRSPSYPAITLEQAVTRARQLYEKARQHKTPAGHVIKLWGYASMNGPAGLNLAALKKFGLLEDEGQGPDRFVWITDLAVNILANPDEREKLASIKTAALNPDIHSELWAKYGDDLPLDDTLEWELTRDRGFTETGAKEFIPEYRATIVFAQLGKSDTMEIQDVPEDEEVDDQEKPQGPRTRRRMEPRMSATTEVDTYFVPIARGLNIAVEGPFPLTESQWEQFQSVLTAMKPALVVDEEDVPPVFTKDGILSGGKDGERIDELFESQP